MLCLKQMGGRGRGRLSDNLRTLGGRSGESHSQVRHRDCRKPKNDPLWLEPCSFLLRVCLLVRRRINRSALVGTQWSCRLPLSGYDVINCHYVERRKQKTQDGRTAEATSNQNMGSQHSSNGVEWSLIEWSLIWLACAQHACADFRHISLSGGFIRGLEVGEGKSPFIRGMKIAEA